MRLCDMLFSCLRHAFIFVLIKSLKFRNELLLNVNHPKFFAIKPIIS